MGGKPVKWKKSGAKSPSFSTDTLPNEILKIVLSYLHARDALSLQQSSKSWKLAVC
jgi:hypothetical protein